MYNRLHILIGLIIILASASYMYEPRKPSIIEFDPITVEQTEDDFVAYIPDEPIIEDEPIVYDAEPVVVQQHKSAPVYKKKKKYTPKKKQYSKKIYRKKVVRKATPREEPKIYKYWSNSYSKPRNSYTISRPNSTTYVKKMSFTQLQEAKKNNLLFTEGVNAKYYRRITY